MKYQKSNITKKYQRLAFFMACLSLLVLVAPIFAFTIKAFIVGETVEKLALGGLAAAAIILVCINGLMKAHLRSPVWLCLLGVYFALENILPLIIMLAVGTILDELVLSPLYRKFKGQAAINKEIDKRI